MKQVSRRTNILLFTLVILGILLFMGIWVWQHRILQNFSALSPPNAFTRKLAVLDETSYTQLKEIGSLTAPPSSGSVVALALPVASDELLAAYSGDDHIRKWNLNNNTISKDFNLNLVSENWTSFDRSGDRFVSDSCIYDLNRQAWKFPDQLCNGDLDTRPEGFIVPGANWSIGYARGSHLLGMECLDKECNIAGTYSLGDVDDPRGLLTIDKGTIDTKGSYFAVAFEQGNIRVYRLKEGSSLDLSYIVELGERNGTEIGTTRSLAFDDTRTWLARLRDGNLSIWDLRLGRNQLYLEMPSPAGKMLAFDPTGTFMLIGTNDTLILLDIVSKKILDQYPVNGLSSLAFSPDGRMIIWGDKQGVIHLWGIIEK